MAWNWGKEALKILIEQRIVMASDEDRAKCPHPEWAPETPENKWRSFCLECGQPAQGSCQG